MTRKALIELVTRRLKYTDSKNQFSIPYVQGQLDMVWQQMCAEAFDMKAQDINYYSKIYSPVAVVEQIDDELYYSDIPVEMIRLPRVGEGVISINQINSREADFKVVRELDFRMMVSQEVYRVGGDIYYYVKYNRVYFGESMTDEIQTAGVEMNVCVPFSKYDLDEELPLPAGQAQVFVEMAVNYLSGTPAVITDNKNLM